MEMKKFLLGLAIAGLSFLPATGLFAQEKTFNSLRVSKWIQVPELRWDLVISGTTPSITIGDAGAEDTKLLFDGNAQDYCLGLDDSADDIGLYYGSVIGTTPIFTADSNQNMTIPKQVTLSLGYVSTALSLTPDAVSGAAITVGVTNVDVGAVTTDANDWIVLPAIANVPVGHTIHIACNAGGNFEMRTPASSDTKINTVDSDGTQEYLCVDAEVVVVTKVSDTDGWAAYDIPALGGVGTATIPD
jgi:hypothetical protein